jgi:hypothetical protein
MPKSPRRWRKCDARQARHRARALGGSVKQALRHGIDADLPRQLHRHETLDMLEAARTGLRRARHRDPVRDAARGVRLRHLARQGGRWATRSNGTRRIESLREMHRRGIRVLPGGDYGFAFTPHCQNARDLEFFVKYLGFTPMEAIRSTTLVRRPDHDAGHDSASEGRLPRRPAAGRRRPAGELSILRDPKRILAVMKDGVRQAPESRAERAWARACRAIGTRRGEGAAPAGVEGRS